jgi:hypothetical protein
MHRQICWVEKNEDGVKREIRVNVSRGAVKWQFKAETDERWDYTTPPTTDDWNNLMERLENRYHRRNVSYDDYQLVKRCHAAATGQTTG